MDAELGQVGFHTGADAEEFPDGEWPHLSGNIGVIQDGQTIGFMHLSGHLGQEFRRPQADTGGNAHLIFNPFLQLPGDGQG